MALVDNFFRMYSPEDYIDDFPVGEETISGKTIQEVVDEDTTGTYTLTTSSEPNSALIKIFKVRVEESTTLGTLSLTQAGTAIKYGVIGGQTTSLPPWIVKKP